LACNGEETLLHVVIYQWCKAWWQTQCFAPQEVNLVCWWTLHLWMATIGVSVQGFSAVYLVLLLLLPLPLLLLLLCQELDCDAMFLLGPSPSTGLV
jgi:hypothetical protein